MTHEIQIDGRTIGPKYAPYIIAELSANHNGSVDTAKTIIKKAREAGADAVKLQTYRPDTITLDSNLPDFRIEDGLWKGMNLFELYEQAHTPWDWHGTLFEYARSLGITIFSSPFDSTAVDLLEDLNTPAYKIASFEVIDLPLIRYVASTGKPIIISTGLADLSEIEEAVDTAMSNGCKQLAILHCVSGYPTPSDQYNLRTLADLSQRFRAIVGLSDHTIGNVSAIVAAGLGANIIEKHFTLDREGGGPDDSFSLEPDELLALCKDTKEAWASVGAVNYDRAEAEKGNVKFRRSIYSTVDIKKGDLITTSNVRSVRPGYGLKPKFIDDLVGQTALTDIPAFSPMKWDYVKEVPTSGA